MNEILLCSKYNFVAIIFDMGEIQSNFFHKSMSNTFAVHGLKI